MNLISGLDNIVVCFYPSSQTRHSGSRSHSLSTLLSNKIILQSFCLSDARLLIKSFSFEFFENTLCMVEIPSP